MNLLRNVKSMRVNTRNGMTEIALVLVCKRPMLGVAKQRLAACLGRATAKRIADALLACALEDARDWPGPVVIAPAHLSDYAWAASLLPQLQPKIHIVPQADGNLGQRLNAIDHHLRDRGLERLIYIGSDAPVLAAVDYAATREALLNHDSVLKPAADGGVVLMGSRLHWPTLDALPWSTGRLGSALAGCCRKTGQSLAMLPQGFDVDEEQDVIRLIAELKADQRPARRALHELACDIVSMGEPGHAQV
ncbi:MAG TPA: DUF2064 domain-containing protein [Nitrosospira sp.]|nr:DUF2064 domain-containing protein [Nitrosospira sp.]